MWSWPLIHIQSQITKAWSVLFNDAMSFYGYINVSDRCINTHHWWEDTDRKNPTYLDKNPSQCHLVPHKPHMDWPKNFFLYSLLYSVLHPYLFTCFDFLTFCLVSLLTTHNTDIHDPGGIRTRNPSKRSAADPRPRPLSHLDRQGLKPGLRVRDTWAVARSRMCEPILQTLTPPPTRLHGLMLNAQGHLRTNYVRNSNAANIRRYVM